MNKAYVYDERPGFESYNMMNFGNPGMPMMYPTMNYQTGTNCSQMQNSNLESKISKLETEVNNLQNRVSRLEGSMYPQAVDYNSYPKATYQNSMNMM
jgi:tetrahydromethanopterin S-methyltransferase subunit B